MKLAYLREKGTHSVQLKGLVVDQRETEMGKERQRSREFLREREKETCRRRDFTRKEVDFNVPRAHKKTREGLLWFRKDGGKNQGKRVYIPPSQKRWIPLL